ncbi:MAG: ABC transporter permease [Methanobacterium sp.]|uniref:ABC transporter permease n=1 Tax=Methanobacterium sp. TaxID=2164 RepID=UPI003C7263B5
MKFRSLILKNIFRNKSRSILAVIGIAIGVAAVVGLGLITDDLTQSTQSALTAGAADFSVINSTNSPSGSGGGPGFGNDQLISQTTVGQISQVKGVSSAVGELRTSTNLGNSTNTNSSSSSGFGADFRSMTNIIGIDSSDLSMDDIAITNGTAFSNSNQVIIGQTAAQRLNKTVGSTITISNKTFTVTGIYETGNFMDDRGIVMSLSALQNLTGDTGQVSLILVKASNGTDPTALASTIQQNYANDLSTSTSLSGNNRMQNGLQVISSGAWAVSLLAILIGGIIVIVTMMKAVSERTREIGVLRAIGWTQRRILGMIIGEALVLSLIAIVVGLLLAVGIVELISLTHLLRGINPSFSLLLILKGIGVALFLGIIGGIYPAYRASRLSPTEALRYE